MKPFKLIDHKLIQIDLHERTDNDVIEEDISMVSTTDQDQVRSVIVPLSSEVPKSCNL